MSKKITSLWYYDVFPKVVPTGVPVTITIRSVSSHITFPESTTVRVASVNEGIYKNRDSVEGAFCPVEISQRELKVTWTFPTEQEYQLRIQRTPEERYILVQLYALEEDLLQLKPLIGDFHAHSTMSDGQEAPEFVASRYREEGYDFFTLTDHRKYGPSILAQNAYRDLNLDFQIYAGEEIHTEFNPVHLVNFGSEKPINPEYLLEPVNDAQPDPAFTYRPEWIARVEKLQASLPEIPKGIDPFIYCSCLLVTQLVREARGMCILAHPHWITTVRNVPDPWIHALLDTDAVDVLEVISGMTPAENQTQISLYNEMRAQGRRVPIVGSSDSHGTCNVQAGSLPETYQMFTEEKTMVFARSNTKDDIIAAVKDCRSVALEQYAGESLRIHGPYRLTQYALFLMREYFPLQQEICREEGRRMRSYCAGDVEAGRYLRENGRKTSQMREKYFLTRK